MPLKPHEKPFKLQKWTFRAFMPRRCPGDLWAPPKGPRHIKNSMHSGITICEFTTCRDSLLKMCIRSRPGKPYQRKGQNEKFMNFAHFCEFWCFSLGKQARFTLNFCSGMPLRKVHELIFLVWFAGATPECSESLHFPY